MLDNSKIDDVVENHCDYLLNFAMYKVRDIDLAKDLVQDALVSGFSKFETFQNRSELRTWLTSILNRKIIDYWRKAETKYVDSASNSFNNEETNMTNWIENIDPIMPWGEAETQFDEDTLVCLSLCIDKLSPNFRGIVEAKYSRGCDSNEICSEFGISKSNLWVIIYRAKIILRSCIKNQKELNESIK